MNTGWRLLASAVYGAVGVWGVTTLLSPVAGLVLLGGMLGFLLESVRVLSLGLRHLFGDDVSNEP